MLTDDFKNFVFKVQVALGDNGVVLDAVAVLNIADALYVAPAPTVLTGHEDRVQSALASERVMDFVREGKKISAIKEMRTLTGCGLEEAKDAVEDSRISWQFPPLDY